MAKKKEQTIEPKEAPFVGLQYEMYDMRLRAIELTDIELKANEEINCEFELSLRHKLHIKDKIMQVEVNTNIVDQKSKQKYALLKADIDFLFRNLDEFMKHDNSLSGSDIPDALVIALNSVAISTMRGIMFMALRGTPLHSAILPLIMPDSYQKVVK